MLGQNFGAGITSRELYQDAILMTSSYRQNCLWPALAKVSSEKAASLPNAAASNPLPLELRALAQLQLQRVLVHSFWKSND